MANSPRTRTTKPRPTRAKVNGVAALLDDEPDVVRLSSADVAPDDPSDLEVLFYIDDTPYYVSTVERAELSLLFLHKARTEGQEVAMAWMFEEMLGADGYAALMNFKRLPADALAKIADRLQRIMLGGFEAPKGPPRRG